MRNFSYHLSQMKSHYRQENVRAERQMCKQDNYNCTRAHNFKARTTNRGKGLTVTLARTLCGVPWSARCPPHACHSHGVWAHPPGSRIQQTIENLIHYGALSQHRHINLEKKRLPDQSFVLNTKRRQIHQPSKNKKKQPDQSFVLNTKRRQTHQP